jgi:hypothetical protein
MIKSPWVFFVLGALALWFLWGRKVTATVTAGDGTARFVPTPLSPERAALAADRAAAALTATLDDSAAWNALKLASNFGVYETAP